MTLESMMIVAAILFCIGLYGSLARRNVLMVLMSIELMFNGVNLTLVALAKYVAPAGIEENIAVVLTGQVFAVFIITVAAAEVALGESHARALVNRRSHQVQLPGPQQVFSRPSLFQH